MKKTALIFYLIVSFNFLIAQQFDTITDNRDGQQYRIVKIGDQWWMAQNLNYYTPKGSLYQNNDSAKNAAIYGRLYEWNTAINACPTGWHVPSHQEWRVMEMGLGFTQNEPVHDNNLYGTDEGGKLKEAGTTHWLSPNSGATNSSGFTALPGGHCFGTTFWSFGVAAHFWAGNKSTNGGAWYRSLLNNVAAIHIFAQEGGYKSVRCIRNLNLSVSSSTLIVNGADKSTSTFNITSNTTWTVSSSDTWLTISLVTGSNNETITLTASENKTQSPRVATISIAANGATTQTIKLTQEAGTTGMYSNDNRNVCITPNPTTGIVYLSYGSLGVRNMIIEGFNLQGNKVFSKAITNSSNAIIDLTGYPKGVYMVKLRIDGTNYNQKICIE